MPKCALLLPLFACAAASAQPSPPPSDFPADAQTVAADSFASQVAGRVYVGQRSDGGRMRLDIRTDGTLFYNSGGGTLSGKWHIDKDGKFCSETRSRELNTADSCNEFRVKGAIFYYKRVINGEVVALLAQ